MNTKIKNTNRKDRIIQKLEVLLKYKKLSSALAKENDKIKESRGKAKDNDEIQKIKEKLKK